MCCDCRLNWTVTGKSWQMVKDLTKIRRYADQVAIILLIADKVCRNWKFLVALDFTCNALLFKYVTCLCLQEAVDKYDTVVANLEFARELQKQFQSMSDEVCK